MLPWKCVVIALSVLVGCLALAGSNARAFPPADGAHAVTPPERRVYVPLEDLDVVFERDQRGVVLPREKFLELTAAARKNSPNASHVPPGAVLSSAEYRARFDGDQLVLAAELEFRQFTKGRQALALPFRGVALETARLDDQPAQLGRSAEGDKPLILFSNAAGRHRLKIELSARLATVGADRAAAFELPAIPAAVLNVALPAGKFLLLDEVALERPTALDQPAMYTVGVGGRRAVSLRVTDRQTEQAAASLVFASTAIGVRVAPEELAWQAVTTLQVFGKGVDRLQFNIPQSLEIVSIESSGLERWEITPGPDEQTTTLKLSYRQPVQESRKVTFRGVATIGLGQPWRVPTLTLDQAAAHVAHVVVQYPAGLRLQALETTGVRPVLAEGAAARAPNDAGPALHFAAWQPDFALLFVTQPKARELQATIATRLNLSDQEIAVQSRISVQTRFAPLFELDLTIPAEWSITDVRLGSAASAWSVEPGAAGLHLVRIPFDPPIAVDGKAELAISARHIPGENWPIEQTPLLIQLPEIQLPQVGVTEGTYLIAAGPELDVAVEELAGLDPSRLPLDQQAVGVAPRFVYDYQDTRFSARVKVVRKPTRLVAQTSAFHRLSPQTLATHFQARLVVRGGGARGVDVALSESAGDNLQFRVLSGNVRIVEQVAAKPVQGVRLWSLRFDQRAHGVVVLAADAESARAAPPAQEVVVPVLRLPAAERQEGFVAIEAATDQQLTLSAAAAGGEPLAEIDPADMPAPAAYEPRERIVAAYHSVAAGYRIGLTETRFDRVAVPTALCDVQRLTSVLGESGEFEHKAEYDFRAVGVQSLVVRLPSDAVLWSVVLNGAPVEVRRVSLPDGDAWTVPLPTANDAESPYQLRLIYRTTLSRIDAQGVLRQALPQIAAVNGLGDTQPLEILQRTWTLYTPPTLEITAATGFFEPTEKPQIDSLLGRLQRGMTIGTHDVLWLKFWSALIAALVIGLTAWASRRRGWLGATLVLGSASVIGAAFLLPAMQTGAKPARLAKSSGMLRGEARLETSAAPVPAAAPFGTPALPPVMANGSQPAVGLGVLAKDDAKGEALSGMAQKPGANANGLHLSKSAPPPPRGVEPPSAAEAAPVVTAPVFDGLVRDMPADNPPAANDQAGGVVAQAAQPGQPAPGLAGAPAAAGERRSGHAEAGGRLSLDVELESPVDSRVAHFRYVGSAGGNVEPELELEYQNRRAVGWVTLALETGVLLLFWLTRGNRAGLRSLLAVLGLLAPLALVPVVPLAALPWLDGVFTGTVAGLALWLSLAVAPIAWEMIRTNSLHIPRNSTAGVLVAATLFAGTGPGCRCLAQEAKPAAAPVSKPPAPPRPAEIVIPYLAGDDPLQAERVFLPYARFIDLWNQAHPDQRKEGPAPADGTVAEALYAARLTPVAAGRPASVEVTARLALYSFRAEQVTLPLPLEPVALTSAVLDGRAAPLVSLNAAEPQLGVVLSAAGLHVLDLKFELPVEQTGPSGKWTIPLKPVPAGTLQFTLPTSDVALKTTGVANAFRLVKRGDATTAVIPVAEAGRVTLSWAPVLARAAGDEFVQAEGAHTLLLGDDGARFSSGFALTVRQGVLSEIVFDTPDDWLVRQISGPDLAGWEFAGEAGAKSLKVFLRRPVSDSTQLVFDLFKPHKFSDEPAPVAVPQFKPRGVAREFGLVAVYGEPQLTLTTGTASGVAQVDAGRFSPAMPIVHPAAAPQTLFRYAARPFELQVLAARQKPLSRGLAEHALLVAPRRVRLATRLELNLAGAPRSEIVVQLPPGYMVYDVQGEAAADYFVAPPTGGAANAPAHLHIELDAPRTGRLEFSLVGVVPRRPADQTLAGSVPVPLGMSELKTLAAVWLEANDTAAVQEAVGWKSLDPEQLPAAFKALRSSPPQFAFQSAAVLLQPLRLALHSAVPRLSADSLVSVIVRETEVQFLLALKWTIAQAGESRFVFTTPDWLEGRLDFGGNRQGPRIRQIQSEKIAGNRLRWTLSLEEPQSGMYFVTARAALPPPAARVAAPEIAFEQSAAGAPGATPLLAAQRHFLMLVNQSPYQLEPATSAAVEPIAAEDVPIKMGQALVNQAAEILRVRDARAALGWQVKRLAQLKSLAASVNLAEIVLVVAADGSWRAEADFRISNRSRQFLALRMPADSRVLSLSVAGHSSRPVHTRRADQEVLLLPLPKTAAGDLAAEIRLVYAGRFPARLPHGVQVLRSTFDLPAPQVLSQVEDAEFGMPVARTAWTVYLPQDLDVKPLDDPARTNVIASVEGHERLVAQINECLELASEVVNVGSSSYNPRARMQAENNLKVLSSSLENSQRLQYGLETAQRQSQKSAEIADLYSKWQSVEKQLQSHQPAAGAEPLGESAAAEGRLSSGGLERELQLNNAISFTDETRERLDDSFGFNLPQTEDAKPPAGEAKKNLARLNQVGKGGATNRTQLRSEAASQAQMLYNEQVLDDRTPHQQAGDGKSYRQPQANQAAALPPAQAARNLIASDGEEEGAADFGNKVVPGGMGGAMGGMGGGMGFGVGGGMIDPAGSGEAGWTSVGGLSLAIELPKDGQKMTFSKIGGAPRLAVGLRPRASLETGGGLVWSTVWVVFGLVLTTAFSRPNAGVVIRREAPMLCIMTGLAWFFLLPGPAFGFGVFMIGSVLWAWRHRTA